MNCPKCGNVVAERRNRCEVCGKNIVVYRKAFRLSNSFYNRGLEKAQVRDLTGAVLMLKKSLEINKRNTDARNLLGLVFFEMGETVAALSEWVVSKHFKPNDNQADEYMAQIQQSPTKLDAMNQAIKKYNIALDSAKQGNDDMAILQLKKVISLNPHFIRAYQLLALVYMRNHELERARRCLVKAGKIDFTNTKTLRYSAELNRMMGGNESEKSSHAKAEKAIVKDEGKPLSPISSYREEKPNIMPWVHMVLGVLVGIAVVAILVVPTVRKNAKAEYEKEQLDFSSELNVQLANIASLETRIESLQATIDEQQAKLDQSKESVTDKQAYSTMFTAVNGYLAMMKDGSLSNEEVLAIAALLRTVSSEVVADEQGLILLNQMKDEIYPKVYEYASSLGQASFEAGEYETAYEQLLAAYDYNTKYDSTLYYLGKTCQKLNDTEGAVKYYNLLLSECPNSSFKDYVESRLEEIGQ